MKRSWSDSQSSSGDVLVYMSSFSEVVDINITASLPRASVWVVNKTESYINTEVEVIFKSFK